MTQAASVHPYVCTLTELKKGVSDSAHPWRETMPGPCGLHDKCVWRYVIVTWVLTGAIRNFNLTSKSKTSLPRK